MFYFILYIGKLGTNFCLNTNFIVMFWFYTRVNKIVFLKIRFYEQI